MEIREAKRAAGDMISERLFASQFSGFWRSALPNLEAVTRSANLAYDRVSGLTRPTTSPSRRDLISEAGYFLFFESVRHPTEPAEVLRSRAVASALEFLNANILEFKTERDELSAPEADEVDRLARWLRHYFGGRGVSLERVSVPSYRGHGIIQSCKGDFECSDTLVEMKYVDRQFRSHDLRQVIVYSALRYYEGKQNYKTITIVNPLLGIEFTTNIDELIYSASGSDVPEFFQKLSYTISNGEVSH
ncbi:hypothetical protein [Mesorhizobium sp. WSM4887]|uniref:hypothetical protein n=1 Tax=Mesorhizobium sp. WSM4887 TaxID=3038543 RepID=UPI0024175E79|nr:hypothetical protein [Mesorhizobium sp. WSM4887]MDG4890329.1 hypothetical protein [Mesorhizobium sp. WSM4887]